MMKKNSEAAAKRSVELVINFTVKVLGIDHWTYSRNMVESYVISTWGKRTLINTRVASDFVENNRV